MRLFLVIHLFWANVLGFSHTQPSGDEPWRLNGIARMDIMTRIIVNQHADLGALSEFERPQAAEFKRKVGKTYGLVYPGRRTNNSVFYRRDKFVVLNRLSLSVPYFNGHRIRIPVARLHIRKTHHNVVVIAVHNPANTRRFPRQGHWRMAALWTEVHAVNRLHRRFPYATIVIAGDFNARRIVHRIMLRNTILHSVRLKRYPIDQAYTNASICSYKAVTSRAIRKATDHGRVYSEKLC